MPTTERRDAIGSAAPKPAAEHAPPWRVPSEAEIRAVWPRAIRGWQGHVARQFGVCRKTLAHWAPALVLGYWPRMPVSVRIKVLNAIAEGRS